MTLNTLNLASDKDAFSWFMQTCTSEKWCIKMVKHRPFENINRLKSVANELWGSMENTDFMQAFQGHPMIGDISTLREKYAQTKALASNEQSGTKGADDAILLALQASNKAYLERHGFIFIIFASGLSANTMLSALEKRLPNTTEIEIQNAAKEQIKITLNRIDKAFNSTQE